MKVPLADGSACPLHADVIQEIYVAWRSRPIFRPEVTIGRDGAPSNHPAAALLHHGSVLNPGSNRGRTFGRLRRLLDLLSVLGCREKSSSCQLPHHLLQALERLDASNELAAHRWNVFELAHEIGTVTEACWWRHLDRTSLQAWKRCAAFGTFGVAVRS